MDNAFIRKLEQHTSFSIEERVSLDTATERVRRFGARDDIVVEGRRPEAMIVVLSGWASRYKVLEDGRRQVMAILLPGDMCDLNVFVLDRMDHSIGALTPVTVAEITRPMYEALMHGEPRIVQALWRENLVAAAIQREWAMNLGQRDATERMAHLFCELFLRLQAIGQVVGNSCEVPLTQASLGEAAGLSAVHVNRTLQDLRAAGLIVLRGRVLTILDMDGLMRMALFTPDYLHLGHSSQPLRLHRGQSVADLAKPH